VNAARHHRALQNPEGSILLEVLVAIVLMALVLGPLVSSLLAAGRQAESFRAQNHTGAVAGGPEQVRAAWSWGPQVAWAAWQPGQVLALTVQGDPLSGTIVGLWADGWLLGEFGAAADGSAECKVGWLGARAGQELVARARVGDGAWGPPWRSVVPDNLGVSASLVPARVDTNQDPASCAVVVHPPCHANPLLEVSDPAMTVCRDGAGLHLFLAPFGGNAFSLRLNGVEQDLGEEERDGVDLYY
jgi:hypothetical protein